MFVLSSIVFSSALFALFVLLILGTFASIIIFKVERKYRLLTTAISLFVVITLCSLTFLVFATALTAMEVDTSTVNSFEYESSYDDSTDEDTYDTEETESDDGKIDCVLNGKRVGPDDEASRFFGYNRCNEID